MRASKQALKHNLALTSALFMAVAGVGQQRPAPRPDRPITIDQLRSWMFTPDTDALRVKAMDTQFRTRVPAWFPEELFAVINKKVEGLDMAAVALPYYQSCLSEEQAAVLIKLSSFSSVRSMQRSSITDQTAARLHGNDTEVQVDTAMEKTQERVANLTDEQKREIMRSFSAAEQKTIASLQSPKHTVCMHDAAVSTSRALGEYGSAMAQEVIHANQEVIRKARNGAQQSAR